VREEEAAVCCLQPGLAEQKEFVGGWLKG